MSFMVLGMPGNLVTLCIARFVRDHLLVRPMMNRLD